MPTSWGRGAPQAPRYRALAARVLVTAFGLVGTAWAAAAAYGDRWASGADIPVVAGVFAAPLAARLLVRGAEQRDRRLLWSLAASALPLYLTALWVVTEVLFAPTTPSLVALRRALLEGSIVTAFGWCGIAAGAAVLAAAGDGPPQGRRVLLLAATTVPAAAALGWSLDRLPGAASVGPVLAAVPAALFLPWAARGLDGATTARLAVVSAVALFGAVATGALSASVAPSALPVTALEGYVVEAPVAILRLGVPAAALVPALSLVVAVRALHGSLPGWRTAVHASLALAVCMLPLVLHALALRETRAPLPSAAARDAVVARPDG